MPLDLSQKGNSWVVFLGLIVPAWKLSSGPRTLQFLATLFHSFPEIFLVPRSEMCFPKTFVRERSEELGLGPTIIKARFHHSCGFDTENKGMGQNLPY